MREEEKKNLFMGKKSPEFDDIIASVLVENMICFIFFFLFFLVHCSLKCPLTKTNMRSGCNHLDCLVHGEICKLTNCSQKANSLNQFPKHRFGKHLREIHVRDCLMPLVLKENGITVIRL